MHGIVMLCLYKYYGKESKVFNDVLNEMIGIDISNKAELLSLFQDYKEMYNQLLYENSNIYLERKYNIYQKFCRYEQECSNAKSSKIGEGWNANPEVIADIAQGSATP
jgi:hypothetical protein